MIIDATTKTGAVYRIDYTDGFWMKHRNGRVEYGTGRIWKLMTGTSLSTPWDRPEDWEDSELPVVDKHLHISSMKVWYTSTLIVSVEEVPSWDFNLELDR